MTTDLARSPIDQELVVHLYAALDGPRAPHGYDQIRRIWERCRDEMGMDRPIAGTGLPIALPTDPRTLVPGKPAAAQEHPTADFQAVVRREHDVVNLSVALAAPLGAASRRLRIGSASPPGWVEFDRWWAGLTADGTEAVLGETRVYQAKFAGADLPPLDLAASEVRRALPDGDNAPYWWQRGWTTRQGFAVWELSPDDTGPGRRIVVLAPQDQDAQLSAWTWSQGQPDMPPCAATPCTWRSCATRPGSGVTARRSAPWSGGSSNEPANCPSCPADARVTPPPNSARCATTRLVSPSSTPMCGTCCRPCG